MKKSILIHVTDADIANGVPNCPIRCPIALAAGRRLPWLTFEVDDRGRIRIGDFGQFFEGDYQSLTGLFVERFDHLDYVEPFSFTIDIDEIFLKQSFGP
jgi:hypothetical protein